jgi:hypothetical protein
LSSSVQWSSSGNGEVSTAVLETVGFAGWLAGEGPHDTAIKAEDASMRASALQHLVVQRESTPL